MTKQGPKRSPTPPSDNNRLSYQGVYTCPICRYGQLSALTLTDAFACNFCHHIFTANLQEQSIQVADSSQPLLWRWTGRTWKGIQPHDSELRSIVWLLAIALVAIPSLLVWLSVHTFPPLEGSTLSWLPKVWIGLTFLCHFTFVAWLIMETYQFPFYTVLKVKLRQWFRR